MPGAIIFQDRANARKIKGADEKFCVVAISFQIYLYTYSFPFLGLVYQMFNKLSFSRSHFLISLFSSTSKYAGKHANYVYFFRKWLTSGIFDPRKIMAHSQIPGVRYDYLILACLVNDWKFKNEIF